MAKNKTQLHWETIGGNYSEFWKSEIKNKLNKKELQFINYYVNKIKAEKVLDVGIGSGRLIENYLNNKRIKEIYGVDWAKSMVEFCNDKFKNNKKIKELKTCNIVKEEIFPNKKYDFISAIRVLKYNRNWREIIEKLIAKIEDNGIVVFTMPNKNALARFTKHETGIHVTTKNEIEKVIKNKGGKIVEIKTLGKLPDFLYDISNNKIYVKIVISLEELLRKIFGDIFLGKIFFVTIKKS